MAQQFEELLEGISQCLISGDWHGRRGANSLPAFTCQHGAAIQKNDREIMAVFRRSVDQLRSHRALALQAQELEQSTASTFCGRFDTHLLCGCGSIQPTYEGMALVGLRDDQLMLNMLVMESKDQIMLLNAAKPKNG